MDPAQQIIILGSVGGNSGPVQLQPPSGFPAPSFNVFKTGSGYSYDYNIDNAKLAFTSTIYCGPGGSNSNNGTTWALRVRSLKQAIALVNAQSAGSITRIAAQAGMYRLTSVDGSSIPDSFGGTTPTRDYVVEPCDGSGNIITTGDQRIISVNDQAMPSFVLVSANVYSSTYTTQVPSPRACDMLYLNSKGNPQALRNLTGTFANPTAIVAGLNALAAKWGQGAMFNDTVNKIYYVQMSDNRAPDSNLIVFRGIANDNSSSSVNLKIIGYFAGTQNIWMRDVHQWGGCFYNFMFGPQGNNLNMWLKDCAGLYSCYHAIAIDGPCALYMVRFTGDDAYKDGGDYDQSSTAAASATGSISGNTLTIPGAVTGQFTTGMVLSGTGVTAGTVVTNTNGEFNSPETYGVSPAQTVASTTITGSGNRPLYVVELDCTFDWCGDDDNTTNAAGLTTCNASSMHVNGTIIRINSKGNRTQNIAFDNITASLSWNLGCQATNCRTTSGTQGAAINLGNRLDSGNTDTCKGWFDGFVSSGNVVDILSEKGGAVFYRNFTPATPSTSLNGGTVTTY